MGLFDFFRKQNNAYQKPSHLEILLQRAAAEPAYRAKFYKQLLTSNLVAITKNSSLPHGKYNLQVNTNVNLATYDDGKIPIFTSTERIFDKGVVKEQVSFIEMKGANLLKLAKGATFLLNPYSDYGKELLPDEVEQLLNGQIFEDRLKTMTIKKETRIQLGQPSKYPTEIIASLKVLYANKPNVKAAYLGWIFAPDSGEQAHYIFGIDAEGDTKTLNQDAGFIAKKFLAPDDFVDFIRIGDNSGISNYFLTETQPFYERAQ